MKNRQELEAEQKRLLSLVAQQEQASVASTIEHQSLYAKLSAVNQRLNVMDEVERVFREADRIADWLAAHSAAEILETIPADALESIGGYVPHP